MSAEQQPSGSGEGGSRQFGALRHYLPILVGLAVLVVAVVLTPTVVPSQASSNSAQGNAATIAYPPGDAPGDPGISSGGVVCKPGARQVSWSAYAPLCQPAYSGTNNGGSTSTGVNSTTITVSFRFAATPAEVALAESLAPGAIGTEAQTLQLTDDYVKVFNKDYDLYGRHVVVKPFTGQGDVLLEAGGQDQPQADADAATAKSLGAFADASSIFNTTLYDNALAQEGIISVGGLFQSAAAMRQETPYEYSPGPDCEKAASSLGNMVGGSLAHRPAVLAGSSQLKSETRVFGLLVPDTPTYDKCAQSAIDIMQSTYHQTMAGVIHYGLTSLAGTTEAENAIAQFKSEGVTTVLCACDPLYPIYFTAAANAQQYHPEWLSFGFGDSFSRLPSQNQWAHAISTGIGAQPQSEQEAYRAYRMVDSGLIPPLYTQVYEPLVLLFGALQAAGPDLTPQHFEQGFTSLPTSLPGGQFGEWSYGPGTVDPSASFQVLQWSPTKASPLDGRPGTWLPCDLGVSFKYSDIATGHGPGQSFLCPISF